MTIISKQEWSCCPHSAAGRVFLCRQDLGSSKLWLVSYTPPFSLLLSLPPLSLLCILLALASLPSWGLGYHGNRRNALFCGWLAVSSRWISAPLCSALKRGWCFAWNVKQWARDYPPWSLSLSPYIAHSHACALSCCLSPLSLSLWVLQLKTVFELLLLEWVITGSQNYFHLPSPANASLSARLSTASSHEFSLIPHHPTTPTEIVN